LHTNRGLLTVKINLDVDTRSAYDAEVIALLLAHELSAGAREVKVWSDCESAIKCLNGGGLGSYKQLISGWRKSPNVKFLKVKAHPEAHKRKEEWTNEEKGNYLADKVAGGAVTPMLTINASEWLLWIGNKSKICITDLQGRPYILDHRIKKSRTDTIHYLEERDKYRLKDGKSECWKGANLALHHRLLGRSNKIGDRVITQRLGLIKRWQWHSSRADNMCAGCNQVVEGISHPLRTCKSIEMVREREAWWSGVERVIMRTRRELHERLFSLARLLREGEGGEVACCGSFLPSFVAHLPNRLDIMTDAETKAVLKVLKEISGGARKICRSSAEIQIGLCGINWRQTTIGQYFKPKPRATKARVKRNFTDAPTPSTGGSDLISKKDKNKLKSDIARHNLNISVNDIFSSYISLDNTVYWEFRAG
jgi:hypothetical protein